MTCADSSLLKGRYPEFARMSRRPAVGLSAMWEVADALMRYQLDEKLLDVPLVLAHGRRQLPLGRYLRSKLREMIGRDGKTPKEVLELIKEEMRPLRESAFNNSKSYALALKEEKAQKVANFKARQRIHGQKRGSL